MKISSKKLFLLNIFFLDIKYRILGDCRLQYLWYTIVIVKIIKKLFGEKKLVIKNEYF